MNSICHFSLELSNGKGGTKTVTILSFKTSRKISNSLEMLSVTQELGTYGFKPCVNSPECLKELRSNPAWSWLYPDVKMMVAFEPENPMAFKEEESRKKFLALSTEEGDPIEPAPMNALYLFDYFAIMVEKAA